MIKRYQIMCQMVFLSKNVYFYTLQDVFLNNSVYLFTFYVHAKDIFK